MSQTELHTYTKNQQLRQAFSDLNLDLAAIMDFAPYNLDMENRRLESLLQFVKKYQQYGNRAMMEAGETGYLFPPIFPGISPESDWFRFELWMEGKAVRQSPENQFPAEFKVEENIDDLSNEAAEQALDHLIEHLAKVGLGVSVNEEIPAKLLYKELRHYSKEEQEVSEPMGGWTYDGCGGYCPGCFQRPWCNTGQDMCWTEDEEAGKMHLIEEVQEYVSASPVSLPLLQKAQIKHDEFDAKFKAERAEKAAKQENTDGDIDFGRMGFPSFEGGEGSSN